ncbi:MAG TPA: thioesterase [Chloroflexi bacterium]|nr:thioesterase [Chloroflexota bacterium]
MGELTSGLVGERELVVTEEYTAAHWGSGLVPVFGTPALVGLMEGAAVQALASRLPAGQTSVGGRIDVRHLAATPLGMRVRARAELVEIAGRRLMFQVQAWDEVEQIGEATHERFIVVEERFIAKASAKTAGGEVRVRGSSTAL